VQSLTPRTLTRIVLVLVAVALMAALAIGLPGQAGAGIGNDVGSAAGL